MTIIDFEASKRWNRIPKEERDLLVNNVYCSNCSVTTIIDFSIRIESFGLVLEGKCIKCKKRVARVVENGLEEQEDAPEQGLYDLKLSQPAKRALKSEGIETFEQIVQYTEKELLSLHGFGPKSIPVLKSALAERGLTFKQ